jgi:hypothetical protein
MPKIGVWTPQEIADSIEMPRQFVLDIIAGKRKKYFLPASKIGRSWGIADSDAVAFIDRYRNPEEDSYTPNSLAKAIGKSRKYVLDSLTGYGGRKLPPRLKGGKRGDRWVIRKEEAERFIGEHVKPESAD